MDKRSVIAIVLMNRAGLPITGTAAEMHDGEDDDFINGSDIQNTEGKPLQ